MNERVVEQQLKAQRGVLGWMIVNPTGSFIADPDFGTCANQRKIEIHFQKRDLLLESRGRRPIIVVLSRDVASPRDRNPPIERPAEAKIVLVDHADTRVTELVQYCGRSVGGAVVEDNELKIGECLREYAVDGSWQTVGTVTNGKDYAD